MEAGARSGSARMHTERLDLEPLRVEHADELAALLDDPGLHRFIGGVPATPAELRQQYLRMSVGHSPDGTQRWLNWVLRERHTGRAIGTVQATVTGASGASDVSTAEIAWVVAVPYQGQGYATEAARAMVAWLRARGADVVLAHVHPRHAASAAVARAVGLVATDVVVDGETRWQG